MPAWQGKSKGNALGYRIFVAILKNLGVLPAYFVLRFVAVYYLIFSFESSRNSFDFFHHRMGFNKFKSLLKIYKNYYLFGQSLIDKVVVMSGIPNKFTFEFDGESNLRQIVDLKKGGLLISAHIGNWEIAGHLLERLQARVNVVMFDGEHEQIKQYLSSVTGKRNLNVIVIKNDLSHIYEISEAFKNNELVCIHADRYLETNKTLSVDFLGEEARFPMGPFILAATFKVPVSMVFAMKESSFHYHFFASGIKKYDFTNKEKTIAKMLKEFKEEVEKKVKEYPEQWYNYYNFWQQS